MTLCFQSCALYWPEEYGYTVEYGPLSIELLFSSEADTNITVRTFKLTNTIKVRLFLGLTFIPRLHNVNYLLRVFKLWPHLQYKPCPQVTYRLKEKIFKKSSFQKPSGLEPRCLRCSILKWTFTNIFKLWPHGQYLPRGHLILHRLILGKSS